MRKILPVLLLLCALLLAACGKTAGEQPYSLTFWYAESDPLAPSLLRLADEYNRQRGHDTLAVTAHGWSDEEHMLRAMQSGARPALLLCTHELAFTLSDLELLCDPGFSAQDYPDWLRARSECVGRGLYPVGFELPLFFSQADAPGDLSALLDQAAALGGKSGEPCLAVDRFAPLFYQTLLDAGKEFHADSQRDGFVEDYVNLYNRLAAACFTGGLTADVTEQTPWRIESSAALRLRETGGGSFRPLSDGVLLAEGRSLAVTARDTRMQRALPDFLGWLFTSGNIGQAALDAGLIPAVPEALTPRSALEETLVALTAHPLHLPDAQSEYYVNRSAFEEEFLEALELLH